MSLMFDCRIQRNFKKLLKMYCRWSSSVFGDLLPATLDINSKKKPLSDYFFKCLSSKFIRDYTNKKIAKLI